MFITSRKSTTFQKKSVHSVGLLPYPYISDVPSLAYFADNLSGAEVAYTDRPLR